MTTHQEYDLTTPEAIRCLVQVHLLLSRARAEAWATAAKEHFADLDLAGALEDLEADAQLMFPEGVVPAFDEWPPATGASPLELARQAEVLTREHPIAHFPPPMTTFVARLIDVIRDFA